MQPEERDAALLLDMLTHARSIAVFTAGKTWEQYARDEMLRSAVEREIEIIGEAARGVSPSFRAAHPEIPWKGIVAQRHVLAHNYGRIKNDRIWDIVTTHLLVLIHQLEPLIPPLPTDEDHSK